MKKGKFKASRFIALLLVIVIICVNSNFGEIEVSAVFDEYWIGTLKVGDTLSAGASYNIARLSDNNGYVSSSKSVIGASTFTGSSSGNLVIKNVDVSTLTWDTQDLVAIPSILKTSNGVLKNVDVTIFTYVDSSSDPEQEVKLLYARTDTKGAFEEYTLEYVYEEDTGIISSTDLGTGKTVYEQSAVDTNAFLAEHTDVKKVLITAGGSSTDRKGYLVINTPDSLDNQAPISGWKVTSINQEQKVDGKTYVSLSFSPIYSNPITINYHVKEGTVSSQFKLYKRFETSKSLPAPTVDESNLDLQDASFLGWDKTLGDLSSYGAVVDIYATYGVITEIKEQPKDAIITSVDDAEFTVNVIGENLSYEWSVGDLTAQNPNEPIQKVNTSAISNTSTLKIAKGSPYYINGKYVQCKITGKYGTVLTKAVKINITEVDWKVTSISAEYIGPIVGIGNDVSLNDIVVYANYTDMKNISNTKSERITNYSLASRKISKSGTNTFRITYTAQVQGSSTSTFTTTFDVLGGTNPNPVRGAYLSNVTKTEATVFWTEPATGNVNSETYSEIIGYEIYLDDVMLTTLIVGNIDVNLQNRMYYNIFGLEEAGTYKLDIVAYNQYGRSTPVTLSLETYNPNPTPKPTAEPIPSEVPTATPEPIAEPTLSPTIIPTQIPDNKDNDVSTNSDDLGESTSSTESMTVEEIEDLVNSIINSNKEDNDDDNKESENTVTLNNDSSSGGDSSNNGSSQSNTTSSQSSSSTSGIANTSSSVVQTGYDDNLNTYVAMFISSLILGVLLVIKDKKRKILIS